jgi:hypothetical protein
MHIIAHLLQIGRRYTAEEQEYLSFWAKIKNCADQQTAGDLKNILQ